MWSCKRRSTRSTQLEVALDACEARRDTISSTLNSYTTLDAASVAFAMGWPILCAAIAAVVIKSGTVQYFRSSWPVAVGAVFLPEIAVSLLRWVVSRRAAALAKEAGTLDGKRRGLLDRVKKELPMQVALSVLMAHDPQGDHRAFIECPPHLMKQIESLSADRQELLQVLDEAIFLLGSNTEGGWHAAHEILAPLRPALTKFREALPRCSESLQNGNSMDQWIMSKVVATPQRTPSRSRRTPGREQDDAAPADAATGGRLGTARRLVSAAFGAVTSPGVAYLRAASSAAAAAPAAGAARADSILERDTSTGSSGGGCGLGGGGGLGLTEEEPPQEVLARASPTAEEVPPSPSEQERESS